MFWLLLRQNIFYDNLNLQLFFLSFFFFPTKSKSYFDISLWVHEEFAFASRSLIVSQQSLWCESLQHGVFSVICLMSTIPRVELLIYLASASSIVYNDTTVYVTEDDHRTITCPPAHTNNCALNLYEMKGYKQCWRSMVATLQQRGLVATSFGWVQQNKKTDDVANDTELARCYKAGIYWVLKVIL